MSLGDFDLREPSIDAYVAALDASDRRWADTAREIALSDELRDGAFDAFDAVVSGGMTTIPGTGDYEGWKLSGYDGKSARDGYHLTTPPRDGERYGAVVGFVILNRDGTWTAFHDGWNHRPGIKLGSTGSRAVLPSAEAAYRHVVVSQTRHELRHPR